MSVGVGQLCGLTGACNCFGGGDDEGDGRGRTDKSSVVLFRHKTKIQDILAVFTAEQFALFV